jgi:hypothetical protein
MPVCPCAVSATGMGGVQSAGVGLTQAVEHRLRDRGENSADGAAPRRGPRIHDQVDAQDPSEVHGIEPLCPAEWLKAPGWTD